MEIRWRVTASLLALLVFLSVFKLESTPPLWWDEGWTLSVAVTGWKETITAVCQKVSWFPPV